MSYRIRVDHCKSDNSSYTGHNSCFFRFFFKVVFSFKKVVQIVLSPVIVVVQYCKYRYCYCIVKYSIKKINLGIEKHKILMPTVHLIVT